MSVFLFVVGFRNLWVTGNEDAGTPRSVETWLAAGKF